ncbi:hypothetical protein [Marinospirillum sp.]|uniref:GapS6b family protein n=1 Tax=Marinospirillum sp. TaxID=2183934 RepID=UPI00286FFAD9|nr:hypothetical protein [Marinospirillum sp.]MDR9468870.1 hypothetical protein [Marinospirillum sp.]
MIENIMKVTSSFFGKNRVTSGENIIEKKNPTEEKNYQEHNGIGDNIVGNKYVLHDLMPDDLKEVSIEIFADIDKGDIQSAKARINTIDSTGRLGKESYPYLQALKIISGLTEQSEAESIHPKITRALANSDSPKSRDMFLASLIRLRLILNDEVGANLAYKNEKNPGLLSRCQYLEFLANKNEINSRGEEPSNSDIETISKIRGLLREDEFNAALNLAEKAKSIFRSYEFEVVYLQALCKKINAKVNYRSFWLIDKKLKDQILDTSNNIYNLIKKHKGQDKRLFNLAIPILYYSHSADKNLNDICWKYIDKWQDNFSFFSALLHATENKDYSYLEGDVKKSFLLRDNKEKRDELKKKVISSDILNVQDALLALDYLDSSVINKLAGKAISIDDGDDEFVKIFVNLFLYSALSGEHKLKTKKNIPELINKFHSSGGDFKKINPYLLIKLTRNLQQHDFYSETCSILEGVLNLTDPWLSPVMREYLIALYNSSQYSSFHKLISDLHNDAQSSSFYWSIKSHYQENKGDFDKALKSIDQSICIEPSSTQLLLQKARILLSLDRGIGEFLESIDISLISINDENSIKLLAIMYQFLKFSKVEELVVDLFLRDPIKSSKYVSDLSLNLITSNKNSNEPSPKLENDEAIIIGIVFKKGNRSRKAIIADGNKYPKSPYIIDSKSQLAIRLMALKEGDTDKDWVEDLTLQKYIPPYVAAFQISCEIRQEMNDGHDPFYMLQLPENNDDLITFMEDTLKRFSPRKNKDVFSDQKTPLLMKGKVINSQDPCKSALELFTDPSIYKLIIPVENPDQEPPEYVADIYTIIYACLTGLAKSFCRKNIKFTYETKRILKGFREDITSSKHMTLNLSESGQLTRTLGKDIESNFSCFIKGIDQVLSETEVIGDSKILEVDFPQDLNILKDVIDESTLHTIMACHSHNASWLTVDNVIGLFVLRCGIDMYPMHILASKLSKEEDIEEKISGLILHTFYDLPFPVHNEDIVDLLFIFDATSLTVLKKIIEKYSSSIIESDNLKNYINAVPLYIASKYQYKPPFELVKAATSLLNTVFRLQMNSQPGYSAEYNIYISIKESIASAKKSGLNIRNLTPFYEEFIFGHFLDRQSIIDYLQQKKPAPYSENS